MSQLFDLNVQNYSLGELLDFFGLTKNDDAEEVEHKCRGLKQKINNDPKLGDVTKGKIHDFLNKATHRLSQSRDATAAIFGGGANGYTTVPAPTASVASSSVASSSVASSSVAISPATALAAAAAGVAAAAAAAAAATKPSETSTLLLNDVTEHGDTFLITRPSKKVIIEQNSSGVEKGGKSVLTGAPPGRLNRLAINTIKRALNVDTRFRTNYYTTKSTDFVLTIPYKFENVTSMSVASYELPLTYYAISQQYENNCILFQWESAPTVPPAPPNYDKQYIMLIPDGNYRTSYQSGGGAVIENTINGILAGTELSNQTGMAFTADSTSGRSIFTCNSAIDPSGNVLPIGVYYTGAMRIVFNVKGKLQQDGSDFAFNIQSDSRALPLFFGWKLGFRTATYEMRGDGGATGVPQSAVSEGICQISGPQYLFLCIDDYNNSVNNYYVSSYGSSTISPNIIARLNIKQQINTAGAYGLAGGESLTTSLTYNREYFGPVDIQRMRITLVDDFGRVLDLNNMDWSFSLMFECVYSSSFA
jgi:hypothetical protein